MNIRCAHCKGRHATTYDVYLCSQGQHRTPTRAQVATPVGPQVIGTQYRFKVPFSMIENIRDGRYAVEIGGVFKFYRVTRRTRGKMVGCLIIQSKHSDNYVNQMIRYPSGTWHVLTYKAAELDQAVTVIAVDPLGAAILYAQELHECSRCGRDLTDPRSRYYSIGPECEQYWPDLIVKINEDRGEFDPEVHG